MNTSAMGMEGSEVLGPRSEPPLSQALIRNLIIAEVTMESSQQSGHESLPPGISQCVRVGGPVDRSKG